MAQRGVNKVILIGHLGGDPETRYLPSGGAVTNVTVATSETWKDKTSGERQERTEWHRVVFFNRLGEIAGEYLKKGAKIYIEGSLRTRKWQDKDGVDKYTTEIVANEMQMLDTRQGDSAQNNAGGNAQANQNRQNSGGGKQGQAGANNAQGNQRPSNNAGGNAANNTTNQNRQQPQDNAQPAPDYGNMPQGGGNFDDFDDDIPF